MSGNFNRLQLSHPDIEDATTGLNNMTLQGTSPLNTSTTNNNNSIPMDLSSCSLNQSAEYQWFNEDIGLTIGNEDGHHATHANGVYSSSFEYSGVSCGERIASITGSILDELGFNSDDSTSSPLSISLLKSNELLFFSPINTSAEDPAYNPTKKDPDKPKPSHSQVNCSQISIFSTDSLDNVKTEDLCTTKRNNYTLTYEDEASSSLINSAQMTSSSSGNNNTTTNRMPVKLYDIERSHSTRAKHHRKAYNNAKTHSASSVRSIEIQTSTEDSVKSSSEKTIVICYPNYTLPDLGFLIHDKETSGNNVVLVPQRIKGKSTVTTEPRESINTTAAPEQVQYRRRNPTGAENAGRRRPRPMSCNDIEQLLKSRDLSHIQDWPSLNFLLPKEFQEIIKGTKISSPKTPDENTKSNNVLKQQRQITTMKNEKLQRRQFFNNKNKRYSLQEANWRKIQLPEIQEITNEINENLKDFDGDKEGFDEEQMMMMLNKESRRKLMDEDEKIFSFREKIPHYNTPSRMSTASTILSSTSSAMRNTEILLEEKQILIDSITSVLKKFHKKASSLTSPIVSSSTSIGKIIHDHLCPTLYELLSDGLCPFLDTIFGKIPNTVWRVVEASVQYGPTSQTLNELIMRISSEELLADGPMKFSSFITGLLNISSLPSWLYYLRSKDLLLRTHYERTGFLYLCNTTTRTQFDNLLSHISSLNSIHFELDIFHDAKILHWNLNKIDEKKLSSLEKNSKKTINNNIRVKRTNGMHNRSGAINSTMKRSISDERPKTTSGAMNGKTGTGNTGNPFPKSKTSLNIHNEQQKSSNNRINKYAAVAAAAAAAINRPKTLACNTKDSKDLGNFKKLQMKWELLASTTPGENETQTQKSPNGGNIRSPIGAVGGSNLTGSKIPRPISSITSPTSAAHYYHHKL